MPNIVRQSDDGSYYIAYIQEEYWEKNKWGDPYFAMVKKSARTPDEKQVSQNFDTEAAAKRYEAKLYIDNHGFDKIESHKEYFGKDNPESLRWYYICHDCKIIMYHRMNYCFNCPKEIKETQIKNRDIIQMMESGYRVGW